MKKNMKHIAIGGILVSLLLAPVISYGQETNRDATTTREQIKEHAATQREKFEQRREEAEQRIQEHRKELEEKREELREEQQERRERFNELRKERIRAYFERMIRRIESAFERFTGLIERIDSRIEILEENNPNIQTDEATVHLAEAEIKITEGIAFLEEAKVTAEALITAGENDNPRELFNQIRELVKESVDKLREAREDIKNAVRSIKATGGTNEDDDEDDDNATTTATSTTNEI